MCPFLLWKAPVVDGSCYGRLLLCGGLLLWKTPVVEDSGNILLRSVAGAHVRLLSLLYPRFLPSLGIFSTFCLPYTQSHFSTWVYSLISLPYTQGFFLFWVFLLHFASLYPKIFLSLGILTAFCFTIPKNFSFSGYS